MMVRVLNFFCIAAMGLTILALYRVSEQTRMAQMTLSKVDAQIAHERTDMSTLQAQWMDVSRPDRIQKLADRIGMDDTASAQVASLELLPRQGAPLGGAETRSISAQAPAATPTVQVIKISARSGM